MSDEVFNTMTFRAKSLGINNSIFVRSMIMNQEIISTPSHKDYSRIIGLVAKFGNNLNQISHNLNLANVKGELGTVDYDNLINILTLLEHHIECTLND
jgi:hypothetical protein